MNQGLSECTNNKHQRAQVDDGHQRELSPLKPKEYYWAQRGVNNNDQVQTGTT
jgi:hypothetical protein